MLIEHKLYPRQISQIPVTSTAYASQGSKHTSLMMDVFQKKGNNLSVRFAGQPGETDTDSPSTPVKEPEKKKKRTFSDASDEQNEATGLPKYLGIPSEATQPVTKAVEDTYQAALEEVREIWQKPFQGQVAVVHNIAESGISAHQFMKLLGETPKATLIGEIDFSKSCDLPQGYQRTDQFAATLLKDIETIKTSRQYLNASPQQPVVLCLNNLSKPYLTTLADHALKKGTDIHTLLETLAPNLRLLVLPAGSKTQETEPFKLRAKPSTYEAVTLAPPTEQQWASILQEDPTFQKVAASANLHVTQPEAARFVARTQSLFADKTADSTAEPLTRDTLLRYFQDWAFTSKKTGPIGISEYYAGMVKKNLPDYISVTHPTSAVAPTHYNRLYDGLATDITMQFNFPPQARKPFVLVDSTKTTETMDDAQHFERLYSLLAAQPGHTMATMDFNAKGLRTGDSKAKRNAIKNAAQLLNTAYPDQNITLHLKNLPSGTLKILLDHSEKVRKLKTLAPRLQFLLQPQTVTSDVREKHDRDIRVVNGPHLKKKDWAEVLPEFSQFQQILAQNKLDVSPDLLAGFVKAIHGRTSPDPLTEKKLMRHFLEMCQQIRVEEYTQSRAGNVGRLANQFERLTQGSQKRTITPQDVARYIYTAFIQNGPVSDMSFRPAGLALKPADLPEVAAWKSAYRKTIDRLNELLASPVKPLILLQAPWSYYPPHLKQALLQSLQSNGQKSVFSVDMGSALKTIRKEQELSPYDSDDSQLLSSSRPSDLANLLVDMETHLKEKYKLGDQKIVLVLENDLSSKMTPGFFEILAQKAPNLRLIVPPAIQMHAFFPPPPGYELPDYGLLSEHGTDVEIPDPTGKKWAEVLPELDSFKNILAKHKLTISRPQLERLLTRIQQWDANKGQDSFDLSLTKQGILNHLHDLCESIGSHGLANTREITRDDIDRYRKTLLEKEKAISDPQRKIAGAPYNIMNSEELPNLSLDQVIGLHPDTRAILEEAIEGFNTPYPALGKALMPTGGNDNLFQNSLLLYGKPGTGKTMTAKAFAKACPGDVTFIHATGPSLFGLQKYVGDTKQNVERFFTELKKIASPAVVFIDEFDIGERRTANGSSNNAVIQQEMNNVINTLLANVQGVSSQDGPPRFFVFATNRSLSGLDAAVTRRIGNKAEVTLPTANDQTKILRQELEKWHLSSCDNKQLLKLIKDSAGREKLSGSDLANIAINLQKKIRLGLSRQEKAEMETTLGLIKTPAQAHDYLKAHLVVTDDMLKEALQNAVETKTTEESIKQDDPELVKAAKLQLATEKAYNTAYIEHSNSEPVPGHYG